MINYFAINRAKAAISNRFQRLIAATALRPVDIFTYQKHIATVSARIKASFHVSKVDTIGSFNRGSAIRQTSDVDLMFVLRMREVRWGDYMKSSLTVLENVRKDLLERFPNTHLGRDGQAVVIQFAESRYSVDVVPAVFSGFNKKAPVYLVPDGNGDWIRSSPQAHRNYIQIANLKSGGKLRNVAKLLKYWASTRIPELPLISFHIEMLLAACDTCIGAKTYGECLFETFSVLTERDCRALQDPTHISGLIASASTESKRERLSAAVSHAFDHSYSALESERTGLTQEAIRQWNIVFNYNYPM